MSIMDYYPKMSRLLWITIQKSHDLVKTNEIVISKISKFVLPKSRNSAAGGKTYKAVF